MRLERYRTERGTGTRELGGGRETDVSGDKVWCIGFGCGGWENGGWFGWGWEDDKAWQVERKGHRKS